MYFSTRKKTTTPTSTPTSTSTPIPTSQPHSPKFQTGSTGSTCSQVYAVRGNCKKNSDCPQNGTCNNGICKYPVKITGPGCKYAPPAQAPGLGYEADYLGNYTGCTSNPANYWVSVKTDCTLDFGPVFKKTGVPCSEGEVYTNPITGAKTIVNICNFGVPKDSGWISQMHDVSLGYSAHYTCAGIGKSDLDPQEKISGSGNPCLGYVDESGNVSNICTGQNMQKCSCPFPSTTAAPCPP